MQEHASTKYLMEAARWAPSADNSQPWRLQWNGGTLTIGYDSRRARGMTFAADDPATLVSIGALLENLDQAAAAVGIALQRTELAPDAYFSLKPSQLPPPREGPLNHPLFARHTNRLPFRTDALPDALSDEIRGHSQGDARVTVLDGAKTIAGVAGLVRSASKIRFRTREITEWLARSLRFTPRDVESADGLDVATLNLPPGGRALLRTVSNWRRMEKLNRWGAYELLATIEAKSVANASAILAVTGAAGRAGAIDAGRLLERVWIVLNQRGLAVHPYYVVSDQLFRRDRGAMPAGLEREGDALAREATTVFHLSGRQLYMLLRVGYPKRTPVRSRRLPLDTICGRTTDFPSAAHPTA